MEQLYRVLDSKILLVLGRKKSLNSLKELSKTECHRRTDNAMAKGKNDKQ